MEWVETTGKSLDQAMDLALDQLGVDAEDAEFEVLEEPRTGLFGRVRGEARVRARVRPTTRLQLRELSSSPVVRAIVGAVGAVPARVSEPRRRPSRPDQHRERP